VNRPNEALAAGEPQRGPIELVDARAYVAGFLRSDGTEPRVIEACRLVCNDKNDGVLPCNQFGVYAEIHTEPFPNGSA
jgi:hypothetical protein